MKWFNIPTIIGKNINETRLKLLHFDIMFFHLPLKALKKTIRVLVLLKDFLWNLLYQKNC